MVRSRALFAAAVTAVLLAGPQGGAEAQAQVAPPPLRIGVLTDFGGVFTDSTLR